MATYTESFDTSDGDTLGPDLTWVELAGDSDIVSNRARCITSSGQSLARADHALATDNQYCQIKAYVPTAASLGAGPIARKGADATVTYYMMWLDWSSGYRLTAYKWVSGAITALGATVSGVSFTAGDTVRIEVEGTTIRGYINGSLILTRTDSSIASGGQCGFRMYDNGLGFVELDDWEAGDLAASGGTGALSATLDGATSSAAGSLAIAGATAITLAGASTAATGTLAIAGAAAATLSGATSSATGALQIQATAAATLAGATLSAAGALVAQGSGTLAATLDGATAAATGTLAIAGTAAATLAGATLAAEGTLTAPGTGTVFATLAGVSVSAAGHVDIAAALGVTLGDLVVTSTGTLAITGAAAATLAGATLAAVGSEDGAEAVPLAAPVFSRAAAVRTGLSDRSISAQARRIGRGSPG